ncbi:hypothetical protein R3P38DRAFT_3303263 [Favolaschia claudopus]|uniref:Uncharacterized protein n=1 Tax=Favolaschia claudopus TaxID=2862362 RepID=A0AAW0EDU8_9AGAR
MLSLIASSAKPLLATHFVGVILSTMQDVPILSFVYYRNFTTDPRPMKLIVALLLLLDTIQVSLAFTSIYDYSVRLHGDDSALQYISNLLIFIKSVIAFTVQMIYSYRIWRLSAGDAGLTTSIICLALVALGLSAMTIQTLRNPRWDETRVNNPAAAIIFAFTATCDLSIATAQVWLFHRHRLKRGKFPFTLGRRRRCTNADTSAGAAEPVTRIDGPADTRINTVEPPPTSSISSRRGSLLKAISSLAGPWRLSSEPGLSVAAEAGKEEQRVEPEDPDCGLEEPSSHDRSQRLGALLVALTVLVINVGLLTSDVFIALQQFLICPTNGAFLVPYILLSNCASLNSRRTLRNLVENPEDLPVTFDFALDMG